MTNINFNDKNLIIWVVAIVVILIILGSFGFGGYRMMGGYNPLFMIVSWIFSIILIILIIVVIIWAIKHVSYNGKKLNIN